MTLFRVDSKVTSPNLRAFPDPGILSKEALAKFIFDMGKNHTRELGEDLLPTFESYVDKVCLLWNTLTPDNRNMPCYRPSGVAPAITIVRIPYAACAMHHWDIRSRVHPETAYLSPESMPYFIDRVTSFHSFKPGPRLSSPKRYRFIVDGGTPLALDFVIEGDKAHTEKSGSSSPYVTFRSDLTTLILIEYGRLPLDKAIKESSLTFEGESQLGYQFNEWIGPV